MEGIEDRENPLDIEDQEEDIYFSSPGGQVDSQ